MSNTLRIGFMGTPDFVVPVIEALKNSDHALACIYTQPPRVAGRKQQLQNTPMHDYALENDIPVFHPTNFKDEKDVEVFRAQGLDVAIVAAYGMLLPQVILDAPKHGCINIHPSLLPRWRGPSPIQYAIWKGDEETGVSVMSLVKEMDAGPILAQEKVAINGRDFIKMNEILWDKGVQNLMQVLDGLAKTGSLAPTPQSEEGVSYCKLLSKQDGKLDWAQSAQEIECQIRGLNPWPGTWCVDGDGKRLKILQARVLQENSDQQTGTVLDSGKVVCGDKNILQLDIIQPENKKPMDMKAAINGGYLIVGGVLR
jgi:methionyl-tRNA formyltransferase